MTENKSWQISGTNIVGFLLHPAIILRIFLCKKNIFYDVVGQNYNFSKFLRILRILEFLRDKNVATVPNTS